MVVKDRVAVVTVQQARHQVSIVYAQAVGWAYGNPQFGGAAIAEVRFLASRGREIDAGPARVFAVDGELFEIARLHKKAFEVAAEIAALGQDSKILRAQPFAVRAAEDAHEGLAGQFGAQAQSQRAVQPQTLSDPKVDW